MTTIKTTIILLMSALAATAFATDPGATVYRSSNQEGRIGTDETVGVDNPSDNIFHIGLDRPVCQEEAVWLVYEAYGLSGSSPVSRSVNDGLSTGGHLVGVGQGWRTYRERIDPQLLREGDNVVRFTLPEGAPYSYRVRNVQIETGGEEDLTWEDRDVVVEAPGAGSLGRAYVRGFLLGEGRGNARVYVDGVEARFHKGSFEALVPYGGKGPKEIDVEAVYGDGGRWCRSVTIEGEDPGVGSLYSLEGRVRHQEKVFTSGKEEFIRLDGASLYAGTEALPRSARLTVTGLRERDIPALDAGMVNVTAGHAGYRFLPHGTVFNGEVSLRLAIDEKKIPDGYTEQDVRTYYFDEQTHHWVALPLDTILAGEARSRTWHFTDMINGIIKVPESPDAQAYNSTSMKGIKAANPTAGLNLINPPSANNTGNASMGYPLNIPAGRAGMQPQLALSYNSGGGNGWLGLGWNVMTPAITIDTRWGAPRFNEDYETETYSLNGEMLTPVAHRGQLQSRSGSADPKIFYPRVEGSFQRIERYGDGPKTYYWVVTDKGGTKYYYGAQKSGDGIDEATVLRTGKGDTTNIAHWALSQVRDLRGNTINYYYQTITDNGHPDGSSGGNYRPGKQLYLSYVTYTGKEGSDGAYKVVFVNEEGERRKDITINGRNGFKQVTAARLGRIDVLYNSDKVDHSDGEKIRSYKLGYRYGAFHKSLLESIEEHTSADSLFSRHTFTYYDDVQSEEGYVPFEDKSKQWTTGKDDVNGGFLNPLDGFSDESSALSGNTSKDFSAGVSVMVGAGADVGSKSSSVGGSFGYSRSTGEGLLILIDLNGDGLADKVFTKKVKLPGLNKEVTRVFYRRAEKDQEGLVNYDAEPEQISGIEGYHLQVSSSYNLGIEGSGPRAVPIFVGLNGGLSKSTTKVYISDVNGDQLPDIVNNGVVYYNRIDSLTGDPVFEASSDGAGTPSTIAPGENIDPEFVKVDESEGTDGRQKNPLHDVVRMWVAPMNGKVSVDAPVRLLRVEDGDGVADGVRVSIQLREVEKWVSNISATDYGWKAPTGVSNLSVSRGDVLYFRVGSIDNGAFDQVEWAPIITYKGEDENVKDANGRYIYKYVAQEEFVMSAEQEVEAPIDGRVTIGGRLIKPVTSDDITLRVIRYRHNGIISVPTVVHEETFTWDQNVDVPVTVPDHEIKAEDVYRFIITSRTNVDWPAISWRPNMYYTASHDPDVPEVTAIIEDEERHLISFHPTPDLSMYVNQVRKTEVFEVGKDIESLKVFPKLTYSNASTANGTMTFSVKKFKEPLGVNTIEISGGSISSADTIVVEVSEGDKLYIEYHTNDQGALSGFQRAEAVVVADGEETTVSAGVYTKLFNDPIFGPLYRGWGHFAYDGNEGRGARAIDETLLEVSDTDKKKKKIKVEDLADGNELKEQDGYDPAEDVFIIMVPNGDAHIWQGYDNRTWLNASQMSSSRRGKDDFGVGEGAPVGNVRAINKISKGLNGAVAFGFNVPLDQAEKLSAGGSYSLSTGESKVVLDFMDMNGDRYPDIVNPDYVQYSRPNGGLEKLDKINNRLTFEGKNSKTSMNTRGMTASASATYAKGQAKPTNEKDITVSIGSGDSGAGLSGTSATGDNHTNYTWMDVNGDGLPDRVTRQSNGDAKVALNLGYGFMTEETWNFSEFQTGESVNENGGVSVSIINGSIKGGVGLGRSDNQVNITMQDVNGDGLADLLYRGASVVRVSFNRGNGFEPPITWKGALTVNESSSASESVNVGFTFGISFSFGKFVVNPSFSKSRSVTRELSQIRDINADGFPDYVTSNKDSELDVKLSTIGRTNMLQSVSRPLGATITLDYDREGNTYDMPNSAYVLTSVKVFDGHKGDGIDSMLTTFDYDSGYYDRHERDFYGFRTVTTTTHNKKGASDDFAPYAQAVQTFYNRDYYQKGLLERSVMTDADGNLYTEQENEYDVLELTEEGATDRAYPQLKKTVQRFYEGEEQAKITTESSFTYDEYGNVKTITDLGDVSDGSDDISATVDYYYYTANHLVSMPEVINVTDGQGTKLRKRRAIVNENTGLVERIYQYLDEEKAAVHDLDYDIYGNLEVLTRPENAKEERMKITYVYDDKVHTYPVSVSNSYGYTSEAKYDYLYGQVLESTDLNGNVISYTLDHAGRVDKITGPYEQQSGVKYTIDFDYFPHADVPWALTRHYDPLNPDNDLETAIFVDGLGRVLQTKKDVAIFEGEDKPDKEMMTVSGHVEFDALGRAISALYPVLEDKGKTGELNPNPDEEVGPTTTTYDVLNRTVKVILPDGAKTEMLYGFDQDKEGDQRFMTRTIDANKKVAEQFTDARGRVTSVKNVTEEGDVWTSFVYNAMGEQTAAEDNEGHTTKSDYDNLGRRTARHHPDAGTTQYTYDLVGNLIQLETAELLDKGQAIKYEYDHERLTDIKYPEWTENNVHYEYGEAGAQHNRAGRIVLQEDASGAQEFFYGPLGEVIKNVRTVVIPGFDEQTYTTEWEYDTWNRLLSMDYPDGEVVEYHYNVGGLLRSMKGQKKGYEFNYVQQLGYDKFEQRVFLAYGNGTKTTYSYEPDRRRLKNMTAETSSKRLFMDNVYGYDLVNNIKSLKNNAPVPDANLMGGSSEYSYDYDDLYRLKSATGTFKGSSETHRYTLAMEYNTVGGILNKTQRHEKQGGGSDSWVEQVKTTYNLTYKYDGDQPHAPSEINSEVTNSRYTYDENGNLESRISNNAREGGPTRILLWDEENRLRSIKDGGYFHYIYDASGQRVLKGQSKGHSVYDGKERKGGSGAMGNYTVYVNPYIVLRSGGYTKHYYIEGQRITSKLGGGWDKNSPQAAGGDKVNYRNKHAKVWEGLVKNLKFLGEDGEILTAGKSGKIPPGQLNNTGPNKANVAEPFQYYFHPDHLGSTSYITDASGEVYQHLEYFAFGETFVEEHSNTHRTPYLFNGKEMDEETGLYYYGARYYDGRISMFLSIDDFAEKYPEVSGYSYALNNPIKYIDINGDSTYLIVYGAGYLNTNQQGADHDVGGGFKKSAEARAEEIKSASNFDASRDAVVIVYAPSTEKFVDATNKQYATGKIASLDVFSHGYGGGISLGGEAGDMAQEAKYDLREINWITVSQIDKNNFEANAVVTLNGCNIARGGYNSFAWKMSDYLGLKVKAFNNYSEFPTKGGDGVTIRYEGRMIRSVDRKNQLSKYSIFEKGKAPINP